MNHPFHPDFGLLPTPEALRGLARMHTASGLVLHAQPAPPDFEALLAAYPDLLRSHEALIAVARALMPFNAELREALGLRTGEVTPWDAVGAWLARELDRRPTA